MNKQQIEKEYHSKLASKAIKAMWANKTKAERSEIIKKRWEVRKGKAKKE